MESPARPASSPRLELAALLALVLGVLAWFADKAFTIDDPLFLWLGEHIQDDPLDFFGFDVNWNASRLPMHEITENPPLAGYFIAAAASLLGWSEVALHAAFLLPAAAVCCFTWLLARRLCARPLEASLLGLLTPVFLVSSTNVMCDTTMLAFWCGSLWLWVTGLDRGRWPRLLGSSVLAGLAFLTKYYGIALVPLLLAYGLLRRGPGAWCLFALVPLMVALGYDRLTDALYGSGQLLGAARYASEYRASTLPELIREATTGLVFAGGCLLPALVHAPLLWSRNVVLGGLVLAGVGLLAWSRIEPALGIAFVDPFMANVFEVHQTSRLLVVQFLLFALGGASLLALALSDLWRRRDADSALLVLWVLGAFSFAAFVNWVSNGRSILPAAPALGILLVRRLEARGDGERRIRAVARPLALAAAAGVAILVTHADYTWANGVRDTARTLAARHVDGERDALFLGNWGWQYYLEQAGATAVDARRPAMPGSRLLMTHNNTDFRPPPRDFARLVERMEVREPRHLRTNARYTASFYASNVGPMPFAWTPPRPDRYYVFEVTRAFRLHPRPLYDLMGTGDEAEPAPP